MSTHLVIALGDEVVEDEALTEPTLAYLADLTRQGVLPVLVGVCRTGLASENERHLFVERLRAKRLNVKTVAVSDAEQIHRSRQPGVFFVQPDLAVPIIDETRAVDLASKLRCAAVFFTAEDFLRPAEAPLSGGDDIVEHLSFGEMLEIAHASCSPVPPEAVERAWVTNTPFKIHALRTGRWTTVTHDTYDKRIRTLAAITTFTGLVFVTATRSADVSDGYGSERIALSALARRGIRIEHIRFLTNGLTFACGGANAESAREGLAASAFDVTIEPCVVLCVVSCGLKTTSGALQAILESLQRASIVPFHFSDSASTASILVRPSEAARAELALRSAFIPDLRLTVPADGHISFDAATRTLRVRDRSERLGQRQATLLHLLMQNIGKPVDTEHAARVLFGNNDKESIAALRVHVHNIRKKIEDDPVEPRYILTVPNRGYTFARHLGVSLIEHQSDTRQLGTWQAS